MICIANDLFAGGAAPRGGRDMTVLELALFMSVFRSPRPATVEELCAVVSEWFELAIEPEVATAAIANMIANRWLVPDGYRLRPTEAGRGAARPLMNGVVRMLDQGTRLIDVALMMTVLRLSKGELDAGARDY